MNPAKEVVPAFKRRLRRGKKLHAQYANCMREEKKTTGESTTTSFSLDLISRIPIYDSDREDRRISKMTFILFLLFNYYS